MFGIGWTEAIFIALIVLLFVGPKHMPGLFRKLGRFTAELRAASRELRNQIELEDEIQSPSQVMRDLERDAREAVGSPYEEARRMDEELRRDLESAAGDERGAGYEPRSAAALEPGDEKESGEDSESEKESEAASGPAPDGEPGEKR
ncbi:MAG: twin-arginine translocase TatA/TatE family subunit [Polyangia bacterium]